MIRGTRSRTSSGTSDTSTAEAPSIVVAFDMLESDHYTTGTGGIDLFINQAPFPDIYGDQVNTGVRPDLSAAAISGKDAALFSGANGDFITLHNALSSFGGTYGVWLYFIAQFATLADGEGLFATLFTSAGTGLFQPSVRGNGRLRASVRRVAGDSVRTVEGPAGILVPSGSDPTAGGVGFDSRRGKILFASNQDYQYAATGAFTNGYGKIESEPSTVAPIIGRQSSLFLNGLIGRLYMGVGVATPEFFETLRLINQPIFVTPQRTLTITEPSASINRLYQQSGGARTLSFAGTVAEGADTDIEYRLYDATTGPVSSSDPAWTNITTASGGLWTFGPSVAAAGSKLQVKKLGESALSAATSTGLVLVGSNSLEIGQSNWNKAIQVIFSPYAPMTTGGAATALPSAGDTLKLRRDSGYGSFDPGNRQNFTAVSPVPTNEPTGVYGPTNQGVGGNGLTLDLALMQAAQGYPQGSHFYCIGGEGSATRVPGGAGWDVLVAGIERAGGPGWGEFDVLTITDGEEDANNNVPAGTWPSPAAGTYMANVLATIDGIRTKIGDPAFPVLIGLLGRTSAAASDAAADAIKQAQLAIIDNLPNCGLLVSLIDIALLDNQHPISVGYEYSARRRAQNKLKLKGLVATGATGPKIVSISGVAGNSYIEATVAHDGGSGLLDSFGSSSSTTLDRLDARVNAGVQTAALSSIVSGKIRIPTDAPLVSGDAIGARAYYGGLATLANCVRDNTTYQGSNIGVPLQPTRGWITATVA